MSSGATTTETAIAPFVEYSEATLTKMATALTQAAAIAMTALTNGAHGSGDDGYGGRSARQPGKSQPASRK